MSNKIRISRLLAAAALLAVADLAAIGSVFTQPAQAQFFGDDRFNRPRPPRGGFFDGLFGPSNRQQQYIESEPYSSGPGDSAKAPSPRKPDANAPAPTTSIVVMGDSMADWLAYGLEDTFSDSPEIAIIRKNKIHSGLLRYEAKGDLDWWHVARDLLAQEKPSYVIMMLGVGDRQNISAKDLVKEADKKEAEKKKADAAKGDAAKSDAAKSDSTKSDAAKSDPAKSDPAKSDADKAATKESAPDKDPDDADAPSIMAPEPGKRASGTIEFRTDKWAEVYARRIDETIAALKSKGVPVIWVGLPSIKGARSTADAVYLNDLFRGRAEKAGAVYIDVWDGFVDESGKFTTNGPDYEGQVRRLRSNDGVYFTKYGARKLAHYVERELRRYMSNRSLQVSLPSGPLTPQQSDPKVRPLAGPVVPLTTAPGNSEELLGGTANSSPRADAIATQVLVKGEPLPAAPGRADDFSWRGGESVPGQPAAALPPGAAAASAAVTPQDDKKPADTKSGSAGKTVQNAESKKRERNQDRNSGLRPPQPIRSGNWFR